MVIRTFASLGLVLTLSCGGASDGRLLRLPPPPGWEEGIAAERRGKDEFFRTSEQTPLPAAALGAFPGLEYWGPDPRYYFAGELHAYADPQPFPIPTTAGKERPCERYGWIAFELEGSVFRLQVYRLLDQAPGQDSLLVPFRDETSGRETYPAGRYLPLVGDLPGPFVVDFNRAYNPSCAYGEAERFACPRAPSENKLPVRIEAGERGYARDAS